MNKREAKIIALELAQEQLDQDFVDFDSPWRNDYNGTDQEKIEDAAQDFLTALFMRIYRLKKT